MGYSIVNAVSSKNVPRWGNKKQYIAVHYLGVVGQDHDLASDGTGAHYYIYWGGTIYQRCSHDAIVWAVGTAGYYKQKHPYARNANTISIEMCCKCDGNSASADDPKWYFTDATQEACVWLVKKLMKELSIPAENVLRHYDIVNKVCPAPYVHNNKYRGSWTWSEFKAKLTEQPAKITGTQATEFLGLTEKQAAEKALEIAAPIARKYGLLPSILTAQTLKEAGYLMTRLAQMANNVCGMKTDLLNSTWTSPTWRGESIRILTTEYYNGIKKQVYDNFRKYACIEDCMEDRCAFFTRAKISVNAKEIKYHGITECKDYKEQAQLIADRGYATDPDYAAGLCRVVEKYDLARYEVQQTQQQYIVQAGSFVNKSYASNLMKKIKQRGLPAILKQTDGKYVVQCGVFTERKNAVALVQRLKEKGFDAIVK